MTDSNSTTGHSLELVVVHKPVAECKESRMTLKVLEEDDGSFVTTPRLISTDSVRPQELYLADAYITHCIAKFPVLIVMLSGKVIAVLIEPTMPDDVRLFLLKHNLYTATAKIDPALRVGLPSGSSFMGGERR